MTLLQDLMKQVEPLYERTWRASDDLLEALPAILQDFQPDKILEFGPGLSSYILQDYVRADKTRVYVGIDDENPFAQRHQKNLFDVGINAGYTIMCHLNKLDSWYETPDALLEHYSPFDLILLDGPADDAARVCARALELFKKISQPDRTVWIVDDSSRPASGWFAGNWLPRRMQYYASTIIYDRNYDRTTTLISPIPERRRQK